MAAATQGETLVDQTYQNDFMKGMHQQRLNDEFTDVTLQSGDVKIRCHRNVLAVASKYMKAMLSSGVDDNVSPTVELTMTQETMVTIVEYIYTGEVYLAVDTVQDIVKACDILELDTLRLACETFMVKMLNSANVVRSYKFAVLYRLNQLKQKAKNMIKSQFKTVVLADEFMDLSCSELAEWIREDDVNVVDKDVVMEAVLGWVQHDLANRKSSLASLMEHVRLPYCSRTYLRQMKDTIELMTPKCFEYLHEAMAFQADTVHQHEMCSARTVPRTSYRMKSCLVVVGRYNVRGKYNHCHFYEEDAHCWRSMTDPPESVGRFYSVCRVEGGLLLTGGYYEETWLNQCWFYSIAMKKWDLMPPLLAARCDHRSVWLDDCVYVVGGESDSDITVLSSVECLNVNRWQWSALPDMTQSVSHPMVATYGNKLFVFGGCDAQNKDLCCTQIFDTTRGRWNRGSDTLDVCSRGAAVTLNDSIYLVGGDNRTCLKYHPASDTWTRLSQPQHQHSLAPAVVWRGSILVAGGKGSGGKSFVIEAYEPSTDTWCVCSIASLNEKMGNHWMFNVDLHDV